MTSPSNDHPSCPELLWQLSATQLADLQNRGEVSAVEVVDAHLDRIEQVQPAVNALTSTFVSSARDAAREIDRRRAAREQLGPLAGVPFSVKDHIDVAGEITSNGSPHMRENIAPTDAPVVGRLREAGGIPIGHGNLPDFGIGGLHTQSTLTGHTVNPWRPDLTPGGSSGGDAVALATGMAPLGIGTDGGGSLRIPATFNGICALKPTLGRLPQQVRSGFEPTLSSQLFPVCGPMARTMGDLEVAYRQMAGPDRHDPRTLPVPVDGPRAQGRLRIGVVTSPGGQAVDPLVGAALEQAAASLREAGHEVDASEIPRFDDALTAYTGLIFTEFSRSWQAMGGLLSDISRRHVEFSFEEFPPVDFDRYLQLTGLRFAVQRAWAEHFREVDLLLAPVSVDQPPAPEETLRDMADNAKVMGAVATCRVSTLVGAPSVAVPTGLADGIPQGVQLIGWLFDEDACLAAAHDIQRRLGTLGPVDPARRGESAPVPTGQV